MPKQLTFIDLFAGMGGIHLAFESSGAKCVFASEWDKYARETYLHNFKEKSPHLFQQAIVDGQQIMPNFIGDITGATALMRKGEDPIPDFDILTGGFPCQPFSQAGLRKGLDETRGTLFFDILQILKTKKENGNPVKAFFLENVQGLLKHQSGVESTLSVIERHLRCLGYSFSVFKVRASDHGLPQHRPRLFIIGFLDPESQRKFVEPSQKKIRKGSLSRILGGNVDREIGWTLRVGGRGSGLHDRRNWDTYLVNGNPLTISSVHGLKLQGFPKWFRFPATVPESQRMKQLGNSVAVAAIESYAHAIIQALNDNSR
jgi:DNA (cytosine-5)-methyltransferase 1